MTARILELEVKLMKHKRVHEVATKGEIVNERKVNSQMASKSMDTSDDADDMIQKKEIDKFFKQKLK